MSDSLGECRRELESQFLATVLGRGGAAFAEIAETPFDSSWLTDGDVRIAYQATAEIARRGMVVGPIAPELVGDEVKKLSPAAAERVRTVAALALEDWGGATATTGAVGALVHDFADLREEEKEAKGKQPRDLLGYLRSAYRRLSAEELLEEPPPLRFVLRPYIPAGKVAVLAGPGGSNKTTLTCYLAACRALGRPFFGGATPTEGETVILSTEDQIDDYHRKLAALRVELGDDFDARLVSERIHFLDLSGVAVRLVEADHGQYRPTALADDLAALLRDLAPRADLVIMETVSRLAGGAETNESLSILVEAAQRVCKLARVAALLVSHVSQDAGRRGVTDQYAARGGSALGDNGRSSLVLTPLTDENRKGYAPDAALSPEDMKRTLVLVHPKANGPTAAPLLLRRELNTHGPVLRPACLAPRTPEDPAEQIERLRAVVERLTADGIPVTKRKLRAYTDELGCPEKKLERLVDAAQAAGAIHVAKKDNRGEVLAVVPRADA